MICPYSPWYNCRKKAEWGEDVREKCCEYHKALNDAQLKKREQWCHITNIANKDWDIEDVKHSEDYPNDPTWSHEVSWIKNKE